MHILVKRSIDFTCWSALSYWTSGWFGGLTLVLATFTGFDLIKKTMEWRRDEKD